MSTRAAKMCFYGILLLFISYNAQASPISPHEQEIADHHSLPAQYINNLTSIDVKNILEILLLTFKKQPNVPTLKLLQLLINNAVHHNSTTKKLHQNLLDEMKNYKTLGKLLEPLDVSSTTRPDEGYTVSVPERSTTPELQNKQKPVRYDEDILDIMEDRRYPVSTSTEGTPTTLDHSMRMQDNLLKLNEDGKLDVEQRFKNGDTFEETLRGVGTENEHVILPNVEDSLLNALGKFNIRFIRTYSETFEPIPYRAANNKEDTQAPTVSNLDWNGDEGSALQRKSRSLNTKIGDQNASNTKQPFCCTNEELLKIWQTFLGYVLSKRKSIATSTESLKEIPNTLPATLLKNTEEEYVRQHLTPPNLPLVPSPREQNKFTKDARSPPAVQVSSSTTESTTALPTFVASFGPNILQASPSEPPSNKIFLGYGGPKTQYMKAEGSVNPVGHNRVTK